MPRPTHSSTKSCTPRAAPLRCSATAARLTSLSMVTGTRRADSSDVRTPSCQRGRSNENADVPGAGRDEAGQPDRHARATVSATRRRPRGPARRRPRPPPGGRPPGRDAAAATSTRGPSTPRRSHAEAVSRCCVTSTPTTYAADATMPCTSAPGPRAPERAPTTSVRPSSPSRREELAGGHLGQPGEGAELGAGQRAALHEQGQRRPDVHLAHQAGGARCRGAGRQGWRERSRGHCSSPATFSARLFPESLLPVTVADSGGPGPAATMPWPAPRRT